VGFFNDAAGYYQGLIDTLNGGVWSATEAPEPRGSATDADKLQGDSLPAVSCVAATCTAVGDYGDDQGYTYGLIDSTTGSGWSAATAPLPSRAGDDFNREGEAGLEAVWCSTDGCNSVGAYRTFRGAGEALIVGPSLPPLFAPGYRLVARDGGVFAFRAAYHGSVPTLRLPGGRRIEIDNAVGLISNPRAGYLVVSSRGAVFAFGTPFYGSLIGRRGVPDDIVGGAATADGGGYWLVGADGAVYPFGDARAYGSRRGVDDIVAMASGAAGGYWLLGADGSVYAFGTAHGYGTCAGRCGRATFVGIAAAGPSGYWLVNRGGGVFSFGHASFAGSCPIGGSGCQDDSDVVGIAGVAANGYWVVDAAGAVIPFGSAIYWGSEAAARLRQPIVGVSAGP